MKISFWGATEEVTGSMTFVDLPEGRVLVDCGMSQGSEESDKTNKTPPMYLPKEVDAIFVTHAHLDHSGLLPRFVKKGFKGRIYCTGATSRLLKIILLDSASLNEDDFYTEKDVQETLHRIKTLEWNEHLSLFGGSFSFVAAGHILGASSLVISCDKKKIVFSGDLGRNNDPLIPAPDPCPTADLIIMESTYGGKNRTGNIEKDLHTFLMKVSREGRVGIIASFAVARGQMLLTLIHDFFEKYPAEKVKFYMDSPMMKEANGVYQQYAHLTSIPENVFSALDSVESIDYPRQWESVSKKTGPMIIVGSSGMLTGGRIWRHLNNWQNDPKAVLLLPGYQAEGTPGHLITQGVRDLKSGEQVIHWTGEIMASEAFSSHADQSELITWATTNNKNARIFLQHGEAAAKTALKQKLQELGVVNVEIPVHGETIKV
jgi:metallo-beta-lactamase family protein